MLVALCYSFSMATYPEYIKAALRRAHYEQMEDGQCFASIPGFDGLWASGPSIEEAREQLIETLHEWLLVHAGISKNRLPEVDGVSLSELPKRVDPI